MISLSAAEIIMVHNAAAIVPQHILARRATDLNRRIYGSLPWGYHVAGLLLVLAGDSLDAFGRVVYATMIEAAVRGMPDSPGGKPAYDYIQDVHQRGPDALPSGFGKPFATRVFKILLSKFSDAEVAEEAMSQVLLQAARGKLHIKNGADLRDAESYVITVALNAARDILRARGRRREQPLVRERDDDQTTMDVEDPQAFERLDKLLPPSELQSVLKALGEVHPRAPEWLRARLDGDSGQEIAEQWGTSPSWVSKWQKLYLPKVKAIVEHHLREAANRYSYDRRAGSGTANPPLVSTRSRTPPDTRSSV